MRWCSCHPSDLGEHPTFTADEVNEIRMALGLRHSTIHMLKNGTDDQTERDVLSERMRTIENIQDKVRYL